MKSLWSRLFGVRPSSRRSRDRRFRLRVEALEQRSLLATLLVTSAADSGANTLRNAISQANASSDLDIISFAIGTGPQTINLSSTLPALAFPVIIDGTSQPGFSSTPLIELNGAGAGTKANGLLVKGGDSAIMSLVVNRFGGSGIVLQSNNNQVQGCYIGANAAGTAAAANGIDGVAIISGASTNIVGGTAANDANLISGNKRFGIYVSGAASTGNVIRGNTVGLNLAESAKIANGVGIWISNGSDSNLIGGTTAGCPNTIAGNTGSGIVITGAGSDANQVFGNVIGTNAAGAAGLGNGGDGITIGLSATNSAIGQNVASGGNVISGNGIHGVNVQGTGTTGTKILNNRIGLTPAGTNLGNGGNGVRIADGASNTIVGGANSLSRNYIANNLYWGVKIIGAGAQSNSVLGNTIGLNTSEGSARNRNGGVTIQDGATNNHVGGTAAGTGNVISAHTSGQAVGVLIAGKNTTGNQVQGNLIGTGPAGGSSNANTAGVRIERNASEATIGGTTVGARNVIVASSIGIKLQTNAAGVTIQGNLIGTNAAGHADISTGTIGIQIDGGNSNTIGGSTAAARNVISGWSDSGITLKNGASSNVISANYLGVDLEGDDVIANRDNIVLNSGAKNNQIGGLTAPEGNVISGAARFGIQIRDGGSNTNTIVRNLVGVEANGTTSAGNGSHGIFVCNGAQGNQIGGTATGAGNLIANNGGDGVLIGSDAATGFGSAAGSGNSILGNRIFNNTGLGIDLGPNDGVTHNDPNDSDSGPNSLQNFPTISFSVLEGGSILIQGALDSGAIHTFRIEFFATQTPDPLGNGEGEIFLGFATISTNYSNDALFSVVLGASGVLEADIITATATDLTNGNTSEFTALSAP